LHSLAPTGSELSLPTYSNVLYLKARGQSFSSFKITGWEQELANIDRISPSAVDRSAA
jgi:hypothetical protein